MELRAPRLRMPLRRPRRALPQDLGDLYRSTSPMSASGGPPRVAGPDATSRGFERQRELDRECAEVSAAILLASGGRTSNVVVCNLRHGPVVMQALRGVAGELAVDLELLARQDGAGAAIALRSH